jgi:hypothetical protein
MNLNVKYVCLDRDLLLSVAEAIEIFDSNQKAYCSWLKNEWLNWIKHLLYVDFSLQAAKEI